MKKTLFFGAASGLGDRIINIPHLMELKQAGHHVTFLCYEPAYFTLFYTTTDILSVYIDNNLCDKIILIPKNIFHCIRFFLRHVRHFNHVYSPVKTRASQLICSLLAKKTSFAVTTLSGPNTTKRTSLIEAMVGHKICSLYEYGSKLIVPYNSGYINFVKNRRFITIFVSLSTKSIAPNEIQRVINYIGEQNIEVVLVGGVREKWIEPYLASETYTNLLGKTSFNELIGLLQDSLCNISMDGGLMRLGHLLNKNNISVLNSTAYLLQPPCDNLHSFALRHYSYESCHPCSYFTMQDTFKYKDIKGCVFHGTDQEGACRFATQATHIIFILQKLIKSL